MTYKHISKSVYIQCTVPKESQDKDQKCTCHRVRQQNDYCTDQCFNRNSKIQCNNLNCLCQNYCRNRYFGKQTCIKIEIVESPGKGEGLVTLQPITKGTFVIEYIGEVYDLITQYGAKRYEYNQNNKLFYMMEISKGIVIDASKAGNLSRFINHSCQPNCKVQKWLVNGQPRLGIFALRNISQLEQLSYNYRQSFWQKNNFTCRCGTQSCVFKQIPLNTITLSIKMKIGHLMYLRANYSKYVKSTPSIMTWDKNLLQKNIQNLNFQITITISGHPDKVFRDRNMLTRLSKIQCLSYFLYWQDIQVIQTYLTECQSFFVRTVSKNIKLPQIFILGLSTQLKAVKQFLSQFKRLISSDLSVEKPFHKMQQEYQTDHQSIKNSEIQSVSLIL